MPMRWSSNLACARTFILHSFFVLALERRLIRPCSSHKPNDSRANWSLSRRRSRQQVVPAFHRRRHHRFLRNNRFFNSSSRWRQCTAQPFLNIRRMLSNRLFQDSRSKSCLKEYNRRRICNTDNRLHHNTINSSSDSK